MHRGRLRAPAAQGTRHVAGRPARAGRRRCAGRRGAHLRRRRRPLRLRRRARDRRPHADRSPRASGAPRRLDGHGRVLPDRRGRPRRAGDRGREVLASRSSRWPGGRAARRRRATGGSSRTRRCPRCRTSCPSGTRWPTPTRWSPAATCTSSARRPSQLAWVKVAASHHAQHNPHAMLRKVVTVEDVLGSPLVADPLHRLDCCVVTDGGGALVVVHPDVARDLDRPTRRRCAARPRR